MKTSDFSFDLPEELIAKYPPPERGCSRLMILDRRTGHRRHRMVADLPELLAGPDFRSPGGEAPLLVFNNSRVRKARLMARQKTVAVAGQKTAGNSTSGKTEFLLINRVDSHTWRVMVNRAKRRRPDQRYCFAGDLEGEIVEAPADVPEKDKTEEFRYLRFDSPIDDDWLDIHGHIPLPPYIKRDDEESDGERYQTIYADRMAGTGLGPGASAAAPTAGLHFSEGILARLLAAGIERVFITLHVGLGTFLPVRAEHIENHVMHEEVYSIGEDAARRINTAKAAGRKIICVGTTSVRTLESACKEYPFVQVGEGITSIFIYPGYRFKLTDALFTNFHTPGSTLLMLAAAFTEANTTAFAPSPFTLSPPVPRGGKGLRLILESYAEAVREGYRFFSYGDAMLIW